MGNLTGISAILIVLGQAGVVAPDHVSIDGGRYQQLIAEPPPDPGLAWAQHRELKLELSEHGILVKGRWTILGRGASGSRAFLGDLLPGSARLERARWNGAPASLWTTNDRVTVTGDVGERAVLEVEAFVPGDATRGTSLRVLGATTGTIEIDASFPVQVTTSDPTPVLERDERLLTGASELNLFERRPEPATKATVTVARTAMGLTVGDDAVTGYARTSWLVRRGSLDSVALLVRDVGRDLEVFGDNVGRWARSFDRITVELKAPATDVVRLQLRWTTPIAAGTESTLPIPIITPEGALSHESTLELARDGEVDAVPFVPGWTPLASQQLPAWSRGLIRGTGTAAYRRAQSGASDDGQLSLFRFEPVPGPEAVVDIADVAVTTAASGRTLMRARYETTNERADALEITPPAGAELVGAWVAGRRVAVARVGQRLRIPLTRSIETVDGLLGFPVMVAFVGESSTWKRREERKLELPLVHAPVNVERVSLRLPRHYRSRLEPGDDAVVDSFTRGNEVAYGLDDADLVATADVIYRDAIDAWNANDFDRARQRLGELEQIGAKSENQEGLEGNVEILLTGPLAGAPAVSKKRTGLGLKNEEKMERRIRAQARARAGKMREEQRVQKAKAKALKSEGRYAEAAEQYQQAIETTQALRNLDEDESYDYQFEADELEAEMEANEAAAEAREMLEVQSKLWSGGVFAATERRPAPPLSAIAPVVLPQVGETVRYQFVLLEPGAARSVPIDARKRRSLRRRKESSR